MLMRRTTPNSGWLRPRLSMTALMSFASLRSPFLIEISLGLINAAIQP
jgi:hypothetical protein